MEKFVSVKDFEEAALESLDKNAKDYFKSGSDDEVTLRQNTLAFDRILIRPRMLRDVRNRSLKKYVQGKVVSFPIGFAPAGFQGLAHSQGEIASAKAANAKGTIFVLSTYATRSIEEIAEACPNGRKWFQLFPNSSPEATKELVQRAERSGYEAIVVTADAQNFGNKRATARNGLYFPPHLKLANFVKYVKSADGMDDCTDIAEHVHRSLAQDLTWDIVPFLRSCTRLKLILKGVLRADIAKRAAEYGIDGIWISNHGGRQVDTVPQPIDVLSEIVEAVQGRCEIYIDSGIRKGSDVFKALSLGATMAFVGRPQIWGVAVSGQNGAEKILDILRDELDLTMALSGVADVNHLSGEYVFRPKAFSKL